MDFDPIDWNIYNKPPYLFQWLSRGETKKFVSFQDKMLTRIEDQARKLSSQYDIDEAKAALLDRIGRIVSEPREGNDDELFRLLIKLRTLLNTADGTVNDIIKVIEYIYPGEDFEIVPNYPAAISILHDAHREYIDFNRIIIQVIGAGIGYETQERFKFCENFLIKENLLFGRGTVRGFVDRFEHTKKYNGEIYHDGLWKPNRIGITDALSFRTRFDFEDRFLTYLRHNGVVKADGSHKYNGITGIGDALVIRIKEHGYKEKVEIKELFETAARLDLLDYFTTQRKFNGKHLHDGEIKATAAREEFSIKVKDLDLVDEFRTAARHNGMIKADGKNKFNGVTTIGDVLSFAGKTAFEDTVIIKDGNTIKVKLDFTDYFTTKWKFNGTFRHDGQITASAARDILHITEEKAGEIDTAQIKDGGVVTKAKIAEVDHVQIEDGPVSVHVKENEVVEHAQIEDGGITATAKTDFTDSLESTDEFFIGVRYARKHDGRYKANGKIKFNSGILIPT
uniref:Uncharacterized protein n=1 Tax=uncultured bacterium contig00055 TaxID=1181539 RepID=A0A806KFV2_9BACT|nr:hypothetical protein [uncultured bacterium contig00055]